MSGSNDQTKHMNSEVVDSSTTGIVTTNYHAYVSKNEANAIAQRVMEMFEANGIEYEIEQEVEKDRSPKVSCQVGPSGISLTLGITWKTTTRTTITPKGGTFR